MKRKGWTRLRGGCGGRWRHESGWIVQHCGHPMALWPYYLVAPNGEKHKARSGRAFQKLLFAQLAAEEWIEKKPITLSMPM